MPNTQIDLTGQRFGKMVVLQMAEKKPGDHHARCLCRCDCGKEKIVYAHNLKCGDVQSCGCLHRELTIKRNTKHGLKNTRIYSIWTGMIHRCTDEKHVYYKHYGGRGIKVCDEWKNSVTVFYNWAMENGYSDALTIDRIDPDGNYEPSNCRWATKKEQGINKRETIRIEIDGITKTIEEWEKISGVKYSTIWTRYKAGKTGKDIIKAKAKKGEG